MTLSNKENFLQGVVTHSVSMIYVRYDLVTRHGIKYASLTIKLRVVRSVNQSTSHKIMSIIQYRNPTITRRSPSDQLSSLHEEMNRLFENSLGKVSQDLFGDWAPALDLVQDHNEVRVIVELPGLKKEDIELSLQNNILTISGKREDVSERKDAETYRSERYFGKFQRTVQLPAAVDSSKVEARYQDGVLTVTLPKAEEAKPKQIAVNVE